MDILKSLGFTILVLMALYITLMLSYAVIALAVFAVVFYVVYEIQKGE